MNTINIFRGEFSKRGALWIEAVEGFREAYDAMVLFAADKPGPYFLFSSDEQSCIASINTSDDDSDAVLHHKRSYARASSRSIRPPKSGGSSSRAETSMVAPDRSLSAGILEAQDNERRRISRELYDGVGQSLVVIKMELEKLKLKLCGADCGALDAVGRMVDDATAEVSTVAHLLHPLSLETLGLRSSIVENARGFQERTGIQTLVEIPQSLPEFERVTETALLRIVQECLTNIHKHAKASNVTILVTVAPEEFSLEIRDDGIGLPNDFREGVGLRGMRERVKELGGSFHVESGTFTGTSIVASIPLQPVLHA